jgi:hypothetical protein
MIHCVLLVCSFAALACGWPVLAAVFAAGSLVALTIDAVKWMREGRKYAIVTAISWILVAGYTAFTIWAALV